MHVTRLARSILVAAFIMASAAPYAAAVTIRWTSFPIPWQGITGRESEAELERRRAAGEPATWAEQMVAEFTAEHPTVAIEYARIGWEQADALKVQLAAGVGPDVFYVYPALLGELLGQGVLAPIDRYLTAADRRELLPPALELGRFEGRYYLWPWFVVPEGSWIINRSLFTAAGAEDLLPSPPEYRWTVDEFLAAARAVTRRDGERPVFAVNLESWFGQAEGINSWPLWSFLYAMGADFFDPAMQSVTPALTDRVRDTFDLFRRLAFEYQVSGPGDFHAGTLAIAYGQGNQLFRQLLSIYGSIDRAPFEVQLALPPSLPGIDPGVPGGIGGWVVGRHATGERLEWAMRFARFLTEDAAQLTLGIGLPVRQSAIGRYVQQNPLAQFDAVAARYLRPYSAHPLAARIATAWLEAGRMVVQGQWSPDQAADDYARRVNALLGAQ
ncbi:MAG TPA: extracellular solute-binding protein [Gemmatimonadales bacterium]